MHVIIDGTNTEKYCSATRFKSFQFSESDAYGSLYKFITLKVRLPLSYKEIIFFRVIVEFNSITKEIFQNCIE